MTTYRIAFIADIHGILPSLEAVLAEIHTNPPDEIIVVGDFLGGPQPLETLALLQDIGSRFILGNGEVNMLMMKHGTAPQAWWTHRQFDMGRWIYQKIDEKIFDFLEMLPEQRTIHPSGCLPVRVVHGAPWDVNKLVFPHKEPEVLSRALEMIPEEILVFAHNHLPDVIHRDGKLAVNPGSVSNNLNGDTRASYAILTWEAGKWRPDLYDVDYDLGLVKKVFKETGFLEDNRPLARGFLESILTGENIALDFILFALAKASEAGYDGVSAVPDEIWLAAEETFPWKLDF
jgi:putative phosphoesterase